MDIIPGNIMLGSPGIIPPGTPGTPGTLVIPELRPGSGGSDDMVLEAFPSDLTLQLSAPEDEKYHCHDLDHHQTWCTFQTKL